jgi:hypothetical protein
VLGRKWLSSKLIPDLSTLTQLYGARSFVVVERRVLEQVQGASGLAEVPEGLLAICDDLPDLLALDAEGNLLKTLRISAEPPVLVDGRVPKKHKRDFEAIADYRQGKETHLLVFGSGSKSPQRCFVVKAVWLETLKSHKEYNTSKFYQHLLEVANISDEQLNIEGATVFDGKIALANRGTNQIFWVDLKAFSNFLDSDCNGPIPAVTVKSYTLPQILGVHTGFSGACTDLRRNRIYFGASAEDTVDWIQDGHVHGSFIGWIVRPAAADGGEMHVVPVTGDDGEFLEIKIEALALLPQVESRVRMLVMTDNDGGNSEMLTLELRN